MLLMFIRPRHEYLSKAVSNIRKSRHNNTIAKKIKFYSQLYYTAEDKLTGVGRGNIENKLGNKLFCNLHVINITFEQKII